MLYTTKLTMCLIIFTVLVIASLFSLLETATVAISIYKLDALKEKYIWALYAYKLKKKLELILIFSLFGNSLFNAILTTYTTVIITSLFHNFGSSNLILAISTLIVTFMIIVFSEALPKIIAARIPLTVLKYVSIPMYYTFVILQPLIWLIHKFIYGITSLFKLSIAEFATIEEIKSIITDKNSPLRDKHRSILLNSIELEKVTIKEVLIPLRMVEAIDIDLDLAIIQKKLQTIRHTRIIAYKRSLDNIVGFIHVKDTLYIKDDFTLESFIKLIRPLSYVNDFIPILKHIQIAQKNRSRIACVINEHGDISGIACLDDVLEMVFGEFTTDTPQRKQLSVKIKPDEIIADGTMLIRELNELYHLQIKTSSSALTVNGLVMQKLTTIPSPGICFKHDGLVFEILSVGSYWVERVRIKTSFKN